PPTSSARPNTLAASCQRNADSSESGTISRNATRELVTGPAAITTTVSAATAPSVPTSIPSSTNGQRTNQSVAPTSFMISISSRRACTAIRIVLTMTNSATTSIIDSTATPTNESTRVTVRSLSTTDGLSTTSCTTPPPTSARRFALTRAASCACASLISSEAG